ncbi:hypothetical protein LJC49_09980 [Ruminococcaceae bacterium OttesenSCG-928-I18]|nr:hypothetical protein [Ruminococcaceae bacterium OttesenSCG-928-I18]
MDIFKLDPVCKEHCWGNYHLAQDYGKTPGFTRVGESWELSCDHSAPSTIADPRHGGKTLLSHLYESGEDLLGSNCSRFSQFPLKLSLIDTSLLPSLHVHPQERGRSTAAHRENAEILHIIDCAQDAYLYLGPRRALTRRELKKAAEEGKLESLLNRILVHPGETHCIRPGVLHGVGPGILAAQVCSTSDRLYRLDSGTCGPTPEPEEVEKGIEFSNLEPGKASRPENMRYFPSKDYTVELKQVNGNHVGQVDGDSFAAVMVLDGSGILRGKNAFIPFYSTDTIFLGAGCGPVTVEGICELMLVKIPPVTPRYRIPLFHSAQRSFTMPQQVH